MRIRAYYGAIIGPDFVPVGRTRPGAYPDLYVGVFWMVLTVVFLCAANACKPKG